MEPELGTPTSLGIAASSAAQGTSTQGYDLRKLMRAIGGGFTRGLIDTPADRPMPEDPAELLDDDCREVTAAPLGVAAYVDGTQAALALTYRAHRPVYLVHVAAGAVDASHHPIAVREQLFVCCSKADLDEVCMLDGIGDLEIDVLEDELPYAVAAAAHAVLAGHREAAERHLVEDLVDQGYTPILVDGSISGRGPHVVGVVKTTRRRYLADESVLYRLPPGWRSPRFKIAAEAGGPDRYSAYVRMVDASGAPWDFGLIRVETFDPETIDALAARALAERQGSSRGDHRWDRQLTAIRRCEELLKGRQPWVFHS